MTEHKFGTWYQIGELKEFGVAVLFNCNLGLVTGAMYSQTWGKKKEEYGVNYLGNTPHHTSLIPTHFMPLPLPPGDSNNEGNRN